MKFLAGQKYLRLKQTVFGLIVFFFIKTGFNFTDGYGATAGIHHTAIPADTAFSGDFSVITYNIAGLPQIISSAVTRRAESIAEIGRKLNAYDIVHVQEDFSYNDYLYKKGNTHPFRTATKGNVPFGDGLNTLSRFPVSDVRRISWEDCTGADCLTSKGFTFSRIQVAENLFIDFYNVHMNAYNNLSAAAARRLNLKQLSSFIKANSAANAVVLMGDLNGRYGYHYDNIGLLLSENGLNDTWVSLKCKGKIPVPSKQLPVSNILSLTDTCESIDKILFRGNQSIQLFASDYRFEKTLFTNGATMPLSDHHPVSVRFSWKRLPKPLADLARRKAISR